MIEAHAILIAAAVAIPLVASTLTTRFGGRAPAVLIIVLCLAGTLASLAFDGSPESWIRLDDVAAVPLILYIAVMAAVFIAMPQRDIDSLASSVMLAGMSGTLILYTAQPLPLLLVGWIVGSLPLVKLVSGRVSVPIYARPSVMAVLSAGLLAGAVVLMIVADGSARMWAFGLALMAALIRAGIFPFHSWVITAFEGERNLPAISVVSAQAGALLIVRLATFEFAEPARLAFPLLSNLAIISAVLMALRALGESKPRRILAAVTVSQSGFILSGLGLSNVPGITGGLVHWLVVAASTVGLLIVLRALEVRCAASPGEAFLGLGAKAPRLAVLFLVFAFALVGLPGTLGFCAEDLLYHGALEAQPLLGLALPAATSMSAVQLLRLFSRLFLGKRGIHVAPIVDGLPRERWVLTALALFLVLTGVAPAWLIESRIASAKSIAAVVGHEKEARVREPVTALSSATTLRQASVRRQ